MAMKEEKKWYYAYFHMHMQRAVLGPKGTYSCRSSKCLLYI
jgi:hypothetical protein